MPEKPIENDPDRQIDVEFMWSLAINLCAKDPDQRSTTSAVVTRIQDNLHQAITAPGGNFNVDPSSHNERPPVYVWHNHTHVECIGPFQHGYVVSSVAFSPDSSKLASGAWDGTVWLWDAVTGVTLFGALGRHTSGRVLSVAFSPDGSKVISGTVEQDIRIWDARTGAQIRAFRMDITPSSVLYSSDGSRIFVTSLILPAVHTLDAQTGTILSSSVLPPRPHGFILAIGYTPNASQIACYYSNGSICVHDVARGTRIEANYDLGDCSSLVFAFSPDGSRLVARSSGGFCLFEARTLNLVARHLADESIGLVTFSPDGSRIISSGILEVRLWDSFSGARISRDLVGHTDMVASIAISPDGSRIASGSYDGSIRVWVGTDMRQGES